MPNGKTHRLINLLVLLPTMYAVGYYHINLFVAMGFGIAYLICTYIATPDKDLVIPFMTHRCISHSLTAWILLFLIGYHYIGMVALGCVVPICSHILIDKPVTKVKRTVNKLNPFKKSRKYWS